TAVYRQRLRELRRKQLRRRGLIGAVVAAGLLVAVGTYDALGYQQTARFEVEHADNPATALRAWQSYRLWHPTRNLLRPAASQDEATGLAELGQKARQHECAERLAKLRWGIADMAADPEALGPQLRQFLADFPELSDGEGASLQAAFRARRDEHVA